VAFSTDGQRLAAIDTDRVSEWDVRTGQMFATGKVAAGTATAGEPCLAALVLGRNTVWAWDGRGTRETIALPQPGAGMGIAVSTDRQRLACGISYLDGPKKEPRFGVAVWDLVARRQLFRLSGPVRAIQTVAFSPDGAQLAAAGQDQRIWMWDARTGSQLFVIDGHNGYVKGLAFSPDGRMLVSSSWDHTIKFWDPSNGHELRTLRGHTNNIESVSFTHDGQRLLSLGWSTPDFADEMKIWDLRTGQELLTVPKVGVYSHSPTFSPDGERLALVHNVGITLWEAPSMSEPLQLNLEFDHVQSVAFSADGRRLAVGTVNYRLIVWDLLTGERQLVMQAHRDRVFAVAFSADGRRLASGSYDRTVKVWDSGTGQELRTITAGQDVLDVAMSPDGGRVAYVVADGRVLVEELTGDAKPQVLTGLPDRAARLAFSSDGRRLVGGSVSGHIIAWDPQSGRRLPDNPSDAERLSDPYFSPDHQRLAQPEHDHIIIRDLKPPDDQELAQRRFRTALDPGWHEQLTSWVARGDWFGKSSPEWNAALPHLDLLVAARPDEVRLRWQRAQALAELGQWARARADFAEIVKQTPDSMLIWYNLAVAQLADGQTEEYRQTCREMVRRFARPPAATLVGLAFSAGPHNVLGGSVLPATVVGKPLPRSHDHGDIRGAFFRPPLSDSPLEHRDMLQAVIVRTLLLRPGTPAEVAELLPLVGPTQRLERAGLLYRAEKPVEAIAALAGRTGPLDVEWALEELYRALAEHKRGRVPEARAAFQTAVQWLDMPGKYSGTSEQHLRKLTNAQLMQWSTRVEVQLLRREVAERLGEPNK
jgi:WD40 repeat protein